MSHKSDENRTGFKRRSLIQSESGQSIVLLAMVILSFLMFFGFVINTGILVAAKISVQNAADAAAYAGAATQARQLNAISFLNYDMRRQFKKFLYRYVVEGNQSNPDFGKSARVSASNPGYYDFAKNDYSTGEAVKLLPIQVPVVCIPLTIHGHNSDSCSHINLRNTNHSVIQSFGTTGLTEITKQLLKNFSEIQNLMNSQCASQSTINIFVLQTWLFRGDLMDEHVKNILNASLSNASFSETDKTNALKAILPTVNGLGLFPRNIITGMRIETLAKYLNDPAQKEVTLESVQAMEGAKGTADSHERTIQAFRSALSNLNDSVFSTSDLKMTELQNSANQLNLAPVTTNFNTYVQYMPTSPPDDANPTFCNSKILPYPVIGAPVGFRRRDNSFTHYAVRISARAAHLMFLPLKDGIELEAVAAAKPFGSRIGPANLDDPTVFTQKIIPAQIPDSSGIAMPIDDCTGLTGCKLPNLKLDDSTYFYSQSFINELAIQSGIRVSVNDQVLATQDSGVAPNPQEVGHYNILPPWKPFDEMKYEFIPYTSSAGSSGSTTPDDLFEGHHIYRFYAPVFPGGGGSDVTQTVSNYLKAMFPDANVTGNNAFGLDLTTLKAELQSSITAYINGTLQTKTPKTENGESLTFAALELPMSGNPKLVGKSWWVTQEKQVLSSWAPAYVTHAKGEAPNFKPRFGYSVKFVTLQNLKQQGMLSDDPDLDQIAH